MASCWGGSGDLCSTVGELLMCVHLSRAGVALGQRVECQNSQVKGNKHGSVQVFFFAKCYLLESWGEESLALQMLKDVGSPNKNWRTTGFPFLL